MKRFIAFSGSTYYPGGGWNDLATKNGFDSIDEAKNFFLSRSGDYDDDWIQIIDTQTWQVVFEK